jgi:hypothetical protein
MQFIHSALKIGSATLNTLACIFKLLMPVTCIQCQHLYSHGFFVVFGCERTGSLPNSGLARWSNLKSKRYAAEKTPPVNTCKDLLHVLELADCIAAPQTHTHTHTHTYTHTAFSRFMTSNISVKYTRTYNATRTQGKHGYGDIRRRTSRCLGSQTLCRDRAVLQLCSAHKHTHTHTKSCSL